MGGAPAARQSDRGDAPNVVAVSERCEVLKLSGEGRGADENADLDIAHLGSLGEVRLRRRDRPSMTKHWAWRLARLGPSISSDRVVVELGTSGARPLAPGRRDLPGYVAHVLQS